MIATVFAGFAIHNHARTDRYVGDSINDDERSGRTVASIAIDCQWLTERNGNATDLVQFQRRRRLAVHRVDVDLVSQSRDRTGNRARRLLEQILLTRLHRVVRHPDDHRVEFLLELRHVPRLDDHIAPTAIDLVFQRQRDRHRCVRFFDVAVVRHDLFDFTLLSRRQGHDLVADSNDP